MHFDLPKKLPGPLCIDEFKGNRGIWSPRYHKWQLSKGLNRSNVIKWVVFGLHSFNFLRTRILLTCTNFDSPRILYPSWETPKSEKNSGSRDNRNLYYKKESNTQKNQRKKADYSLLLSFLRSFSFQIAAIKPNYRCCFLLGLFAIPLFRNYPF